jgi:serine phosphatase RsbU (regulator of sigma subunit)
VLAGDVTPHGVEGALTASALRGAARAFGPRRKGANQFLQKANSILWTGSAGGAVAGLFHAIVAHHAREIEFAAAGPMRVLTIGADAFTVVSRPSPALGLEEEAKIESRRQPLAPGELLLAYGTTFAPQADESLLAALDQRLALALEPHLREPAEQLATIAGEVLQGYFSAERADRVAVILKRRHH